MYFKKMALCVLMLLVSTSMSATEFQEKEPHDNCGYRLYFTNVTWYTASKICEEKGEMLVLPDSEFQLYEYIFSHLIEELLGATLNVEISNLGIWVGAFLRTSSNESMDYHCKSLYMYPRSILDQSQPRDDILCMFYHYSTGKFKTDSCDNKKSFLCKKQTNGETPDCMMTSNRNVINNSGNYVLCQRNENEKGQTIPYFAIFENDTYFTKHSFQPRENCENNQKPYIESPVLRHVSTFWYLPDPPMYVPDKPISKSCPELQEKIEIRKKNLTVLRKETNKYQRTLISAPDDRPTSKYMGVTGALFISLVAGIIVCIDLTNFCKIFKPVRVKVE